MSIMHHSFLDSSLLLINEVTDQKIYCVGPLDQFFQSMENLLIGFTIHPVITVNHLKIKPCSILKSGIYCCTMAAVMVP